MSPYAHNLFSRERNPPLTFCEHILPEVIGTCKILSENRFSVEVHKACLRQTHGHLLNYVPRSVRKEPTVVRVYFIQTNKCWKFNCNILNTFWRLPLPNESDRSELIVSDCICVWISDLLLIQWECVAVCICPSLSDLITQSDYCQQWSLSYSARFSSIKSIGLVGKTDAIEFSLDVVGLMHAC